MRIDRPEVGAVAMHRPLAKARLREKAFADDAAQRLQGRCPVQAQHADDDHRVVWPVHAPPCRVHAGHALACYEFGAWRAGYRRVTALPFRCAPMAWGHHRRSFSAWAWPPSSSPPSFGRRGCLPGHALGRTEDVVEVRVQPALDLRLQERHQEPELGQHMHVIATDGHHTVDASAFETKLLLVPGGLQVELLLEVPGHRVGLLLGLSQRQCMGAANVDFGHDEECCGGWVGARYGRTDADSLNGERSLPRIACWWLVGWRMRARRVLPMVAIEVQDCRLPFGRRAA